MRNIQDSQQKFEIHFYYGDKNLISPFAVDLDFTDINLQSVVGYIKDSVPEIVKRINKEAKSRTPPYVYTNFSELSYRLSQDNSTGEKSSFSNLFIISDFEHDPEASSFNSLRENIIELSRKQIRQINLVKITEKKVTKQSQIDKTIAIFRESFNVNSLFYYEFVEFFPKPAIGDNSDMSSKIANMFSSTVEDTSNEKQHIVLYNSWDNSTYKYDYVGYISFNCSTPFIGLGCSDEQYNYEENKGILKVTNKNLRIYNGDLSICPLTSDKPEKLTFSTSKSDSKNYYLEIRQNESTQKVRVPIELRQVLPSTSCTYLIILYRTFILCFAFLIVYFLFWLSSISQKWFLESIRDRITSKIWKAIALGVIPILIVFATWLLFHNIVDTLSLIRLLTTEIVFILLLMLCHNSIIHQRKKEIKKTNEKEANERNVKLIESISDSLSEIKSIISKGKTDETDLPF